MPSQSPRAWGGKGGERGGGEENAVKGGRWRAIDGGWGRGEKCKKDGGGGYVHQGCVTGVRYPQINVLHLYSHPITLQELLC